MTWKLVILVSFKPDSHVVFNNVSLFPENECFFGRNVKKYIQNEWSVTFYFIYKIRGSKQRNLIKMK